MATIDKPLPNVNEDNTQEEIVEIENKKAAEVIDTPTGPVEVEMDEMGGAEVSFDPTNVNIDPSQDHFANLAETLEDNVLDPLGNKMIEQYNEYKESRSDWEDTYRNGLELLGFKYERRTEPFRGASGVNHPVLAESVTQFQAQAYKELLPSDGPVRTQILGDVNIPKEEQAKRVKDFMNYQIMDQMKEYEPEFDQMLFYLPLSGSTFKKVYYDDLLGRAVSKFVPADDLIVPYSANSLEDAEAIIHVIKISENELRKQQVNGFYRDIELGEPPVTENQLEDKKLELEGIQKDGQEDQYTLYEIHTNLDLEGYEDVGEDGEPTGIKLPYVITVAQANSKVLSIRRNYKAEDPRKNKINYFVQFKFLPGTGFYGFGLIHMIGGLTRTATAALRQLLDAGTLANLPAGFKSRGIRVRDDDQPIQPGEFRDVDAPGGNIRDQFFNLPFTEPSPTLYNLMGFVVQAGQKFAAITDTAVGNDTQNRAVGTTMALMERGSRVMSGVHKRCYYAMRLEFKILARICGESLPPEYPYDVYGGPRQIKQADFDNRVDILPVADPNIMSMAQRVTLAQAQLQIAQSNPQMHNLHEAYRRVYEALGTKTIDQILKPPPKQPEPLDPAKENARSLQMKLLTAFEFQDHDAHLAAHMAFMQTRMVQINPQVYALLQSHISDHVSFKAKAEVKEMVMQNPQMAQLGQQDPQQFEIMFEAEVAKVAARITQELAQAESASQNKEDPLIKIKQQEIDLRAMDLQRKAEETKFKAQQENQRAAQRLEYEYDKLAQQDEQSDERLEVAREKMQQK